MRRSWTVLLGLALIFVGILFLFGVRSRTRGGTARADGRVAPVNAIEYAPALAISPTVLGTKPGRTVTATLIIANYGGQAATAQISLADVPGGWTIPLPDPLLLQPGVVRRVQLPVTPDAVETTAISVSLHLVESPGATVTQTMAVRVVPRLLTLTEVRLMPSYLTAGVGAVDVGLRLVNHAGLPLATTADVRLIDAAGQVAMGMTVPFTAPVGGRGPFPLGSLDASGVEMGVYTTTVRLLDERDRVISGAVAYAPLAVGQGLKFTHRLSPTVAVPGASGVTVTTVITTERIDVLTGTVPFTPTLKWHTAAFSESSDYEQVVNAPAVGDIDGEGVPDVVVTTYQDNYEAPGLLRVLSGDDGRELWNAGAWWVEPLASSLIVDLENDGQPEIVVERFEGGLYAFDLTGNPKYTSTVFADPPYGMAPAVADVDRDGLPEIVVGRYVLNHTLGGVTDLGAGSGPGGEGDGLMGSIVADVNLDSIPEVIVANTVYSATGGVQAQNETLPAVASNAVGNFDADRYPEIVLVNPYDGGEVYLVDHRMNVIWGPETVPGGIGGGMSNGGPPTVADFDGDDWPEIGVAGNNNYVVFDTDGTVLWQSATQDHSSGFTGSSVFDFQGDGQAEVVYADEVRLRVYDGSDGAILFEEPHASITGYELPVVADVDADGHAEIVLVDNDYYCSEIGCDTAYTGVRVFEAEDDSWVATRQLWHQHAYDVTSVDAQLRVVSDPPPVWLLYNTFRSQAPTPGQGNAYFIDAHHHLPLTGTVLLADSLSPPPLDYTDTQVHWLYAQQDRERLKVGRLSQRIDPPLLPGEARQVSTLTAINYTIGGGSESIGLPPLYVTSPSMLGLSPASSRVRVGDRVTYTLTLTNALEGPHTFDLDVLGLPGSWVTLPPTVTVDAGATARLPLVVSVPANADAQAYTLLARARPEGGEEAAASARLEVDGLADVGVDKAASLDPAIAGLPLTYTVVVTNGGPSMATGLCVSDTLPGDVTLETVTTERGSCVGADDAFSCTLTPLVVGDVISITARTRVRASAIGELINVVQVSAGEEDDVSGNNQATVETAVAARADLSIEKSCAPANVTSGDRLTYTIVVRNLGPSDAPGAIVSDTIPTEVTNPSWTCIASNGATCGLSGTAIIADQVDLPLSGIITYTVGGTMSVDNVLTNTATVTVPLGIVDPERTNNRAVASTGVAYRVYLPLILRSADGQREA